MSKQDNIKENFTAFINKDKEYVIRFENFNGSGWNDDLDAIIKAQIKPSKISKRIIEQSWDYSEEEFDIEKGNIKFIAHLDDDGSAYLLLKSPITESNKEKLLNWATIIAEEVERIKNLP